MSNLKFAILLTVIIFVNLQGVYYLGKLRAEFATETIIQEKHVPSYIDADCILQIMEDE